MFFTIWERYFLKEILKVFALFLFGFFFLYTVMDYSMHMQDFVKGKKIEFFHLITYYSFHFLKRASLLIPLALLISTIKVLTTLNTHHELLAFQASGLAMKKLLRPFFLVAFLCTLFNFFNSQYLLPSSLNYIDQFKETHFKHSYRGQRKVPFHVLYLKDKSKIIYQSYDATKGAFFDVVWLKGADDIWRMKYLKTDLASPQGEFVDHLVRNKEGFLEKTESFETHLFKQLKLQNDAPLSGLIPTENRSLSYLYQTSKKPSSTSPERAEALTHLTYKFLMPLLSIVVIIAAAPFCIRYSRNFPLFFLYAIGLFGFIAFFAFMNAAVILGENQVLSPFLVLAAPFLLLTAAFSWKFAKI